MRWTQLYFATGLSFIGNFAIASGQAVGQAVPAISVMDRLQWALALLAVLAVFFACVWLLRKLGAVNSLSKNAKLRVISGISLGMREKVILLQVGNKQLVLAVTPGHIETLAVLEGSDCLEHQFSKSFQQSDQSFAQSLMQTLKGQSDA